MDPAISPTIYVPNFSALQVQVHFHQVESFPYDQIDHTSILPNEIEPV